MPTSIVWLVVYEYICTLTYCVCILSCLRTCVCSICMDASMHIYNHVCCILYRSKWIGDRIYWVFVYNMEMCILRLACERILQGLFCPSTMAGAGCVGDQKEQIKSRLCGTGTAALASRHRHHQQQYQHQMQSAKCHRPSESWHFRRDCNTTCVRWQITVELWLLIRHK